ncbi:hypothetical protein G6712_04070 [Polynucleobacter paneuropaeus]|nr:hypothetical protein [Polynucleobacter paneuropaeus]
MKTFNQKNLGRLKKNNLVLGLQVLSLVVWLMLFILALSGYSGSKITYVLFSIVTSAMLIAGFRQKISYGYLFLTIFLWLGFWLKMTIHTILGYPFIEPVGLFAGDAQSWDEVLNTASVASLGVMLGKIMFDSVISRINPRYSEKKSVVPQWYANNRKWMWAGMIVTSAASIFVNMWYGLHQIGLPPRTILMWPLNAGFAWMLNIGMATGIALFVWWDITLKKSVTLPFFVIIAEAFLSSVSLLSRAVYVFHTIPQFWAVIRSKKMLNGWSHAKTALVATIFVLFLAVSISAVTTSRNYLYQSGIYSSTAYQVAHARWEIVSNLIEALELRIKNAAVAEQSALLRQLSELSAEKLELEQIQIREKGKLLDAQSSDSMEFKVLINEFGYQIKSGFATRILQLSVDRWIGLEGVMAVQSYPEKKMSLLWYALSGKQEVSKADTYQGISKSIYLESDHAKYRFRALPGAVGFLYYSNSQWIVMLGMVLFSLLILVFEYFISALTDNPIICSLYGAVMASNVAQFGGTPRENLPYFFMLASGIFLVWMVRTNFFAPVLHKLKIYISAESRGN